jgi:type II secretory pathway component GspD/PulD (secretin)
MSLKKLQDHLRIFLLWIIISLMNSPAGFSQTQPIDTQNSIGAAHIENNRDPNEEIVAQKVFHLKNTKPSELGQILEPLLSKQGCINPDDETKTLLVADKAETLTRIEKIIEKFDVYQVSPIGGGFEALDGDPNEIVKLINLTLKQKSDFKSGSRLPSKSSEGITKKKLILPLAQNIVERVKKFFKRKKVPDYETISVKHVHVDELAANIGIIMNDSGVDFRRNISIQPLVRSKLLLVFGKKKYRDMVRKLVSEIDVPNNQLQRKTFKLRYADPEDIKAGIDELFNWTHPATTTQIRTDYGSIPDGTSSADTALRLIYSSQKQIVVLAPEETMKEIAKLIEEWDSPVFIPEKKQREPNDEAIAPITGTEKTGIIKTGADPKELEQIKRVIESSEQEEVKNQDYEIIKTSYLQLPEAAVKLNEMIEKKEPDYVNRIYIQPLASARQFMLFGDEKARQIAKNLLEQIDLPQWYVVHDTINLQHIEAEKAVKIFNEMFAAANIDYKKTIFVEELKNQLLVYGNENFRHFIHDIIKEIDTESFAKAEKYDVFTYYNLHVEEIASSLTTIMKELSPVLFEKVSFKAFVQTNQLLIFGDKDYCEMIRKLVYIPPDTPAKPLQRRSFHLNYADPEYIKTKIDEYFHLTDSSSLSSSGTSGRTTNLSRTSYGTNGAGMLSADTVRTTTYPSLRQIVVLASEENMKQITKLIEQWDSPHPQENNQTLIEVQVLEVTDEFLKQVGLDANSLNVSDKWSKYRLKDSNSSNVFVIDELIKDLFDKAASASGDFVKLLRKKNLENYSEQINFDFPAKESDAFPAQFIRNTNEDFITIVKITSTLNEKSIRFSCEVDVNRIKDFRIKNASGNSSRIAPEIENTGYKENMEFLISSGSSLLIKGPEFMSIDQVSNKRQEEEIDGSPEVRSTYAGYPDRTFTISKRTELILIKPINILWK